MTGFGTRLSIAVGQVEPSPVPPAVIWAIDHVQVTYSKTGALAFGLTFRVGRGWMDRRDYPFVGDLRFKAGNRVSLTLSMDGKPNRLMDGIITNHQLTPSNQPGASTFTVIGEGLTVLLDREERARELPPLSDDVLVRQILGAYGQYRILPKVMPTKAADVSAPTDRVPIQMGTDLAYIRYLAAKHGYVFHITPDPLAPWNVAYWGPPDLASPPQKALSVNLGPFTNVEVIDFEYNALAAVKVVGVVQDRKTGRDMPVQVAPGSEIEMTAVTEWKNVGSRMRTKKLTATGVTYGVARAEAQALTDASVRTAVTATGELDGHRYGDVLRAYGVVGVRGVGNTYDGNYYVSEVTHLIQAGSYRERFELTRSGSGPKLPVVRTT